MTCATCPLAATVIWLTATASIGSSRGRGARVRLAPRAARPGAAGQPPQLPGPGPGSRGEESPPTPGPGRCRRQGSSPPARGRGWKWGSSPQARGRGSAPAHPRPGSRPEEGQLTPGPGSPPEVAHLTPGPGSRLDEVQPRPRAGCGGWGRYTPTLSAARHCCRRPKHNMLVHNERGLLHGPPNTPLCPQCFPEGQMADPAGIDGRTD